MAMMGTLSQKKLIQLEGGMIEAGTTLKGSLQSQSFMINGVPFVGTKGEVSQQGTLIDETVFGASHNGHVYFFGTQVVLSIPKAKFTQYTNDELNVVNSIKLL